MNTKGFETKQVNIWKNSGNPVYEAEYFDGSDELIIATSNNEEDIVDEVQKWIKNNPNPGYI